MKLWKRVMLAILFFAVSYFIAANISFTGNAVKENASDIVVDVINYPNETTIPSEVIFCQTGNCTTHLVELIDSAASSAHCAVFDLDLKEVINALDEKSKTADVKVVVDNDNYKGLENYSFIKHDNDNQLSHNKFCVIDGKRFYTGSFNPTKRCSYYNDNNMVIVSSTILAQNYEDEFNELWNGEFGKGEKVKNPAVILNNKEYENYFCPEDDCEEHVLSALKTAKSSIYFMTFSFTSDTLGSYIIMKKDFLDIKGVFEKMQAASQYSEYKKMLDRGMNVKLDNNKYNMHHKVFIIDNETVVTGSFNPTKNGNENNDENVLIIHDKEIAGMYLEEFERVWNK